MSENNNLTPEQEVTQWKDAFSGKQNPAYQQTVEERIKQREKRDRERANEALETNCFMQQIIKTNKGE